MLATAPFFYFMSHQVFSDMMMTAWLAWALYFLLTARLASAPLPRLVGFYLCVAGALASKGPAALMALLAALAVVLVEDGWRRGLRWLRLPVGLGILALASLPWLLPYLLQPERSYVGGVVVGHYGDWYFRQKPGSRLGSLLENLARFLPWTLFLPAALWWWWRDRDLRRRPLVVWTVVIAAAVSLSAEQRARYFLPVLPPLSLAVAELLARAPVEASGRGRRVLLASFAAVAAPGDGGGRGPAPHGSRRPLHATGRLAALDDRRAGGRRARGRTRACWPSAGRASSPRWCWRWPSAVS